MFLLISGLMSPSEHIIVKYNLTLTALYFINIPWGRILGKGADPWTGTARDSSQQSRDVPKDRVLLLAEVAFRFSTKEGGK